MLYLVVLTFEYVDEIPKCEHPNESAISVNSVLSTGVIFNDFIFSKD